MRRKICTLALIMKTTFYTLLVLCLLSSLSLQAQYAFELKVDLVSRIGNQDLFSISGTLLAGRVENGKTYYDAQGAKFDVKNIISSKTATSVPVAGVGEQVSLSISSKDLDAGRGETMQCISSRPMQNGMAVRSYGPVLAEGAMRCKINGRQYTSKVISKPVYMKDADVLDLFFRADDETVLWLQLNNFSKIEQLPHTTTTDTSNHQREWVCKMAYMPKGFRPTDLPNHYQAYEDVAGNASITITNINRYKKTLSFDFMGTLRPNRRLLEEKPNAGLFTIQEGHADNITWDAY